MHTPLLVALAWSSLLNFSASEFSSNSHAREFSPRGCRNWSAVSADEPPPAAFTIGETLHTEVWRNEMRTEDFKVQRRAGHGEARTSGERYSITFTPDQLGFYTLGSPRPLYAFGINTSAEEADLRPIDKDVLPRNSRRTVRRTLSPVRRN